MSLYDEHAELYDLAFGWDVGPEVSWLIERLGPHVRSVLEPGCGSGRLFPAFARRGVEVVGVDDSESMLERARARMARAGLPAPALVCADMRDFVVATRVDGAVCPVSTFQYLANEADALAHLSAVARHLAAGRRYMVQMDLRDTSRPRPAGYSDVSRWEVNQEGERMAISWEPVSFDSDTKIERVVSSYRILTGPRQGRVVEDVHSFRLWRWDEWAALLSRSLFRQLAAYDGARPDRPAVPLGPDLEDLPLLWHQLELR